jgi:hypothetical protein
VGLFEDVEMEKHKIKIKVDIKQQQIIAVLKLYPAAGGVYPALGRTSLKT